MKLKTGVQHSKGIHHHEVRRGFPRLVEADLPAGVGDELRCHPRGLRAIRRSGVRLL